MQDNTVQESESVRKLLEDVQRTLLDNKKFIKNMKEDDVDMGADDGVEADASDMDTSPGQDSFEEL